MIKRFGLVALWGILIFCGLTAWGQDASEAAVKLGSGATLKIRSSGGIRVSRLGTVLTGSIVIFSYPVKRVLCLSIH